MNINYTASLGFTDSTDLLSSPEKLRARSAEDGYLYFKGFLPKEPLLELRRQILQIVERQGWLKKGSNLMDGIIDSGIVERDLMGARATKNFQEGVTREVYKAIQCLELFHAIPHHPKIKALYSALFQEEAFPHPRHIARALVPYSQSSHTPAHQDYIYIQGTHNFWTLWFPLGDCPVELGSLSVLRGSHREKVLDVRIADGAGGREVNLCSENYEWLENHYECGDILTFPSHLIHKGMPNQWRDRIRLSCDCRYQPASQEIAEGSLLPHMNVAEWDEIYKGWKNKDIQYYWKAQNLNYSKWDASLLENKERLC